MLPSLLTTRIGHATPTVLPKFGVLDRGVEFMVLLAFTGHAQAHVVYGWLRPRACPDQVLSNASYTLTLLLPSQHSLHGHPWGSLPDSTCDTRSSTCSYGYHNTHYICYPGGPATLKLVCCREMAPNMPSTTQEPKPTDDNCKKQCKPIEANQPPSR